MIVSKKKYFKLFFILISLAIFAFIFYFSINKLQEKKEKVKASEPIIVNLLTSVHPKLPWNFKALEKKIAIQPGEVTTVEYLVENIGDKVTSGIATFAYFPNEFGPYISKLNCFCYDAQSLRPKQKDSYSVVLLIDPEVTKDSKTKNIKEVTIQFTFFDYKNYKENKI